MEKILDKYFAKKVIERIKEKYTDVLYIDRKIEKNENRYSLYIKHRDQKEEYWKEVFSVCFNNWDNLYYSSVIKNNDELKEHIEKLLKR